MTFNVPLFGEVWSGTGLLVMSLFVVGGVFGLWSDSDSDVESSLLGFSTAGQASAFVLRMDGMNLWSTGISVMALATSSFPNFISTGLISIPVLKLPIGISCSLSFCISTVLLVSGSSPKANNASMVSSSSVVVHVSCPMGSTLGCTVVFSGSDGTSDVGVLLLFIESLRVCSTARLFVDAFSCPSDCVRELFLGGLVSVPPLSASNVLVFDTRSGSFISSVIS